MLKLEKELHSRAILVRVRTQSGIFNPLFFKALAAAVALHFFGAVIFHIQLLHIIHYAPAPPPAAAQADLNKAPFSPDGSVIAQLHASHTSYAHFPPPRTSSPALPELPYYALVRNINAKDKVEPKGPHSLDKNEIKPYALATHDTLFALQHRPIGIYVTGEAGQVSLLPESINSFLFSIPSQKPLQEFAVSYAIQVEKGSGRIIFFEQQEGSSLPELDKLAEKILKRMRFHVKSRQVIATACVEVMFVLNASGTLPDLNE